MHWFDGFLQGAQRAQARNRRPGGGQRQATKVMFDLADPRIDEDGLFEHQRRERKDRDDARFEALRRDRPQ
jgi:hypothetical protein